MHNCIENALAKTQETKKGKKMCVVCENGMPRFICIMYANRINSIVLSLYCLALIRLTVLSLRGR